jgi:hypothetical protein
MSTEEDLLQEHYMGNRQSRQLFLGYTGSYQQGEPEVRRGKVTRAISVGRSRFIPSGCIHSLVEHRQGCPTWVQTAEGHDYEVILTSYLYATWKEVCSYYCRICIGVHHEHAGQPQTMTKRTECGRDPQRTYVVLHQLSDICL